MKKPNVIFVFADQWRAQATGYAGNNVVKTPNLDKLAAESVNFTNASSGCPVCTPYRASFLKGQYPLTTGLFVNDVSIDTETMSIAQAFKTADYDTAYIGKWHVDGHGRDGYIPRERQQGFDYWKVLECTHDYNNSYYYEGDCDLKRRWDGYDAFAQTDDARNYIRQRESDSPFFMVLSWGPPHAPLDTAPKEYRDMYKPEDIQLRPNVPVELEEKARIWLSQYYAHCSALDKCLGDLLDTLNDTGIADDTIFVFTSDHGDMLGSHGFEKKQKPWEESIRVPFLLRLPAKFGVDAKECDAPVDAPDIMPTLLSLCDIEVPESVEGYDYSDYIQGKGADPSGGASFLACYHCFGQWRKGMDGGFYGINGREYRGIRTNRYTYVRTLDGPWLLYDNQKDPYQLTNLIDDEDFSDVSNKLDCELDRKLTERGDEFLPGMEYIRKFGYEIDEFGTVPY
ncbi:MAG: sulfatase [Sedimentisphaeraceae bacterium JB056]